MQLSNPNLVYSIIYQNITDKFAQPGVASQFLDGFFHAKNKKRHLQAHLGPKSRQPKGRRDTKVEDDADLMRVILIDELDALITQKQDLLYNIFDWPSYDNSRVLVISIANTMDLPERLQNKIHSRIGNKRLVYQPYKVEQIQEILESRIEGINVFDENAIKLCAKKISAYSGDIRRSLALAKRAVEIYRKHHFGDFNQVATSKRN